MGGGAYVDACRVTDEWNCDMHDDMEQPSYWKRGCVMGFCRSHRCPRPCSHARARTMQVRVYSHVVGDESQEWIPKMPAREAKRECDACHVMHAM